MKSRKAFTLIELLVVIGALVILIGILLPVLNHVRREAQISQQKADFQTITAALEHYRQDFGDYPRNTVLPEEIVAGSSSGSFQYPSPSPFLSLAAALLGPGPAVTQTITGGVYEVGDGADGTGFRTQTMNIPVTINNTTLTLSQSVVLPAFQYYWWLDVSPGTSSETVVGINSVTSNGPGSYTVGYTVAPPSGATQGVLKIPIGKVWPNYLDTSAFKVAFVEGVNNSSYSAYDGQPELLDRWGGPIEYFPRYGPANNRTQNSSWSSAAMTAIAGAIGPLLGYSPPNTVDPTNGNFAMFDVRDASPIATRDSNNNISGFVPWQTVSDPFMAVQWMLGCSQPAPLVFSGTNLSSGPSTIPSSASPADTLHFDGPFILISAGPDGPTRTNGGFCNLATDTSPNQYQSTFQASGNIYNFDR